MKLCSDCENFIPNIDEWSTVEFQRKYAICKLTSMVIETQGKQCIDERNSLFFGCGKKAKNFKLKTTSCKQPDTDDK